MTVTKLALVALTLMTLLAAPVQADDLQSQAPGSDDPCPPIQVDAGKPSVYVVPECLDNGAAWATRQV